MFDRRFEATFSGILHLQEGKSLPTHFHSHGNPIFPWEGNIRHYEKTKIPLSPLVATSIKGIFENLLNIPENSICTLNMPKISCPRKLFPEIKIYSIYQTPPLSFHVYFPLQNYGSKIYLFLLFVKQLSICQDPCGVGLMEPTGGVSIQSCFWTRTKKIENLRGPISAISFYCKNGV